MHGISKIRREVTTIEEHWTQEWTNEPATHTGTILSDAIRNKKAFALTDGSYKVKGSAGYSITDFKGNAIKGACRVPGQPQDQSSYRSELAGILATLYKVLVLCQRHNITNGHITVACDNTAAGQSINQQFYPNPQQNHFDLLQSIFRL